MGHDISAYLGNQDPEDPFAYLEGWTNQPEIASLRRGSSNPMRHQLYEVLKATEYDGDVSGIWDARWFNRNQLELALEQLRERLTQGLDVQPEIEFVTNCLSALPLDRSSVFIAFG